jgi:hypothetical protein
LLDSLAIEQPHQVFEYLRLKDPVVLRQHALQRLELIFNGGHRLGYKLWQIAPTGRRFVHNDVITRPFREPECAPAHVVCVYRSPLGHPAGSLILLNLPGRSLEAVRRVPKEDDPQHRHEVIAGRELRISPKIICRFPEVALKFLNIFEGILIHGVKDLRFDYGYFENRRFLQILRDEEGTGQG